MNLHFLSGFSIVLYPGYVPHGVLAFNVYLPMLLMNGLRLNYVVKPCEVGTLAKTTKKDQYCENKMI